MGKGENLGGDGDGNHTQNILYEENLSKVNKF